jgi:hypothetical protein
LNKAIKAALQAEAKRQGINDVNLVMDAAFTELIDDTIKIASDGKIAGVDDVVRKVMEACPDAFPWDKLTPEAFDRRSSAMVSDIVKRDQGTSETVVKYDKLDAGRLSPQDLATLTRHLNGGADSLDRARLDHLSREHAKA